MSLGHIFCAKRLNELKYLFFVIVLGGLILQYCFPNSSINAIFMPFFGLHIFKQASSNSMIPLKEGGSLEFSGYMIPVAYNTANRRDSIQQRHNSGNINAKIIGSNVIPKHFFMCNGPTGRLGNQLFDFASSLGIASTLNYTFVMPSTHPLLKLFEINHPVMETKPENLRRIALTQWRNGWWGSNGTYVSFNLSLSGYYRVWGYFKDVMDKVRTSLTIQDQFLGRAKMFMKSKAPGNRTLIGVRVRRGDFLNERQQQYGKAVASRKYIIAAMTHFQKRYYNPFFVVVSNDKLWCRTNLAGQHVVISEEKEAIVDLAILTLCHHTIVTSGTFGWWGGFLAGGEVVYWTGFPKPGSQNEKTILFKGEYYPPHWTGIDSD